MPIEPPEIPPPTPGTPTEPPPGIPPGNPRPEIPPPVREPGAPPRPDELPGKVPEEFPVRGPERAAHAQSRDRCLNEPIGSIDSAAGDNMEQDGTSI